MTMSPTHVAFNHIVAFEVAKETLVIHVLPGDGQHTIANKPKAIRKLLLRELRRNALADLGSLLVVCEATGGYETPVLAVGRSGRVVNPLSGFCPIWAFWRKPTRSMLACSPSMASRPRACLYVPRRPGGGPQGPETRRDQVQQMLIAETNRLEHARHASVTKPQGAYRQPAQGLGDARSRHRRSPEGQR